MSLPRSYSFPPLPSRNGYDHLILAVTGDFALVSEGSYIKELPLAQVSIDQWRLKEEHDVWMAYPDVRASYARVSSSYDRDDAHAVEVRVLGRSDRRGWLCLKEGGQPFWVQPEYGPTQSLLFHVEP